MHELPPRWLMHWHRWLIFSRLPYSVQPRRRYVT
ncbi:hypothetical protein AC84_5581, partial [Escherichia coli 1-392-07_S4_C1]